MGKQMDGYKEFKRGYKQGLRAACCFVESWDVQIAQTVGWQRFSDIVRAKFNLSKRNNPRKLSRKRGLIFAPETFTWTPKVEVYRKALMEKFANRCSMDQIANAAYILGGKAGRTNANC